MEKGQCPEVLYQRIFKKFIHSPSNHNSKFKQLPLNKSTEPGTQWFGYLATLVHKDTSALPVTLLQLNQHNRLTEKGDEGVNWRSHQTWQEWKEKGREGPGHSQQGEGQGESCKNTTEETNFQYKHQYTATQPISRASQRTSGENPPRNQDIHRSMWQKRRGETTPLVTTRKILKRNSNTIYIWKNNSDGLQNHTKCTNGGP